jgi:hypothetical protein
MKKGIITVIILLSLQLSPAQATSVHRATMVKSARQGTYFNELSKLLMSTAQSGKRICRNNLYITVSY